MINNLSTELNKTYIVLRTWGLSLLSSKIHLAEELKSLDHRLHHTFGEEVGNQLETEPSFNVIMA